MGDRNGFNALQTTFKKLDIENIVLINNQCFERVNNEKKKRRKYN